MREALGTEITEPCQIKVGEAWEVNGYLWKVTKIVKRDRVVLKLVGKVKT